MREKTDRLTFQLSYGDCDALGISYFAIYYPWMERTCRRCSWLRSAPSALRPRPRELMVGWRLN